MRAARWISLGLLLVASIAFSWAGLGAILECPGQATTAVTDSPSTIAASPPPQQAVASPEAGSGRPLDMEDLLFQPMIFPGLNGADIPVSDCRFSDNPYSNCL
jgi:hypothetical protein